MTNNKPNNNSNKDQTVLKTVQAVARVVGIALALPFFIWVPLSLVVDIPTIIDVFGAQGLRIPTGIVIAGLMLAAFGFEEF